MRGNLHLAIAISAVFLAGCGVDMPGTPDGNGRVYVSIVDTSGYISGEPGVPCYVDSAEVSIQSRTHQFATVQLTGPDGVVALDDLATGRYYLFARKDVYIENNKKVFAGGMEFYITGEETVEDTVIVGLIATSELMINEIYYTGATCTFYMYDQFVELYNSSSDTLYLDGIILTRHYPAAEPDQDEVDYVKALYAYQFPGTPVTGREYPILPGQFVAIASDAINHSLYCPTSIDLSVADWECFNPLGSDYDNLGVPNLVNINPSRTSDYLIALSHNAVVIATGEEYSYEEYGDHGSIRLIIPLYTVIDGVEYATSATSTKELTINVDAGFAGIGMTKYSGQSVERRELGLDTNDSTFDFVIIAPPTPGYSHVQ